MGQTFSPGQQQPIHDQKIEYHHQPLAYTDNEKYESTTIPKSTHLTKGNHREILQNKKEHFIAAAVKKPFEDFNEKIHLKLPALEIPTIYYNRNQNNTSKENHEKEIEFFKYTTTTRKPTLEKIKEKQKVDAEKIVDKNEKELVKFQDKVEKVKDTVSQINDDIYNAIATQTKKVFDAVNQKLENIEGKLQKLRPGSVKSIEDYGEEDNLEIRANNDDIDEMRSLINTGKKITTDEFQSEEKTKNKIADAFKKAQDKFNQLIEDQVFKVNNQINEINEKIESLFGKLQSAVKKIKPTKKVYTPPTYKPTSVINWKPKPTTWSPIKYNDDIPSTTPEYYKFTVSDDYRNENSTKNVERLDTNNENEVTTELIKEGPKDNLDNSSVSVVDVEMALGEELRSEVEESSNDDLTKIEYDNFDDGEEIEGNEELPESELITDDIPLNDDSTFDE